MGTSQATSDLSNLSDPTKTSFRISKSIDPSKNRDKLVKNFAQMRIQSFRAKRMCSVALSIQAWLNRSGNLAGLFSPLKSLISKLTSLTNLFIRKNLQKSLLGLLRKAVVFVKLE